MPYRDQPTAQTNSLDVNVAHHGILQHAVEVMKVLEATKKTLE